MAQGCRDPTAPHGSAYCGAPAARTRTGEVVGAAESDPMQTFNDQDVVTLETATARFAQPRTRRSGALSSLISYFHLISGIQQSSGIGHLRAMRGRL